MTRSNTRNESPIRSARLRKGLTQPQAAAEAGYSASYYAMVEREPRLLSERMAERLAAVFGVPVQELQP